MIWGFALHGWEEIMRGGLIAAGAFGLVAALATWNVVTLQRSEIIASDRKLEELRSANLKLEAQIAPRRLKPEQQDAISNVLESFAGKSVNFDSYILDVEAAGLGEQLATALGKAKIKSDITALRKRIPAGSIADGIRISGKDGKLVDALLTALAATDLKVSRGEAVESVGGVTTHIGVGVSVPNPDGRPMSPAMAATAAAGILPGASPWDATIFVGVKPLSQP